MHSFNPALASSGVRRVDVGIVPNFLPLISRELPSLLVAPTRSNVRKFVASLQTRHSVPGQTSPRFERSVLPHRRG